jgi:hypothetical protein
MELIGNAVRVFMKETCVVASGAVFPTTFKQAEERIYSSSSPT